jgi:hypothetical protein
MRYAPKCCALHEGGVAIEGIELDFFHKIKRYGIKKLAGASIMLVPAGFAMGIRKRYAMLAGWLAGWLAGCTRGRA